MASSLLKRRRVMGVMGVMDVGVVVVGVVRVVRMACVVSGDSRGGVNVVTVHVRRGLLVGVVSKKGKKVYEIFKGKNATRAKLFTG